MAKEEDMKATRPTEAAHSPIVTDWTRKPLFTDATIEDVNDALASAHDEIVAAYEATGTHPGILKEDSGLAAAWSLLSSMRDFLTWTSDPAALPARQIAASGDGFWQPTLDSLEDAYATPNVNAIIERVGDRWTHHPIRREGGAA